MIKPLQRQLSARSTIVFLLLALFICSCKSGFDQYWEGENPKGGFLYNKIKDNPQFSLFAKGLERANLVQFIDRGGLYTVFAPTDDAFRKYLIDRNYSSVDAVPVDTLFKVLSFHIVNNMWYYYDLRARFMSAYKQRLYLTRNKKFVDIDVSVENTIKINGVAVVPTLRDIDAENGVIHGIGEVLVPLPNLEELMQADPEISNSTFYKLLQVMADRQFDRFNSYDRDRDGRIDSVFYKTYPLIDRLLTSLEFRQNQNVDNQGGDPVFTTILIPGNDIFDPYIAPVLARFGGKIENLSPSYAEEVLENYVLSDTLMNAAALMNRTGTLRTVNQEVFTNTMLKSAGDFKRKDLRASNGIIHVINSLTFAQSDRQKSALGIAMTDPELTTFFAVMQQAGLVNTYAMSSKSATFFTPTNAVFAAANIDIKNRIINGAQLTSTQFADFVRTHIIPSNLARAALTGTINSDVGATQQLVFTNNGANVTSPSGILANITHPPAVIGPGNVGYVYKIDKLLLPK